MDYVFYGVGEFGHRQKIGKPVGSIVYGDRDVIERNILKLINGLRKIFSNLSTLKSETNDSGIICSNIQHIGGYDIPESVQNITIYGLAGISGICLLNVYFKTNDATMLNVDEQYIANTALSILSSYTKSSLEYIPMDKEFKHYFSDITTLSYDIDCAMFIKRAAAYYKFGGEEYKKLYHIMKTRLSTLKDGEDDMLYLRLYPYLASLIQYCGGVFIKNNLIDGDRDPIIVIPTNVIL